MEAMQRSHLYIIAHASQATLAREIASKYKCIVKAVINLAGTVDFHEIVSWDHFADGFPNLFIQNVNELAGKDVIFLASFHSISVIFEQLSLLYQLPMYAVRSLTVLLPYFPTGTMERIDVEGQIATAKSLAVMLSQIPLTASGPCYLAIFDIHSLQERFYFTSNLVPRLLSAVPYFMELIFEKDAESVIAFPDAGAEKRFGKMVPVGRETIVCTKIRDGDSRQVKIKEGNPKDKHVVIVDDLVQSGGTLLEAGKVLKESGAARLSSFVTHAVFPNDSWRKFLPSKDGVFLFDDIWITDSLPNAREICKYRPFNLLSLSSMIAEFLVDFPL
uniref:Pribosyltran domain-containing protein n=1 Tax=Trichuris muris TaxID=70415 RepID=A0A5S6Q9Y1_TRIMR